MQTCSTDNLSRSSSDCCLCNSNLSDSILWVSVEMSAWSLCLLDSKSLSSVLTDPVTNPKQLNHLHISFSIRLSDRTGNFSRHFSLPLPISSPTPRYLPDFACSIDQWICVSEHQIGFWYIDPSRSERRSAVVVYHL